MVSLLNRSISKCTIINMNEEDIMQFRDLKQQYQVLKKNMDAAMVEVATNCNFINGQQVKDLEKELAELQTQPDLLERRYARFRALGDPMPQGKKEP